MENEKREYRRQECGEAFQYRVSVLEFKNLRKMQPTGVCVDISETGMGFVTGFAIEAGHIIRIFEGDSFKPAIVKWVNERDGQYRAGVMYV